MINKVSKYIALIVISIVLSNCSSSKNAGESLKLVFDDVNNFWEMYDQVKLINDDAKRIEIIEKDYLEKATFGLRLLILKDNLTALEYSNQLKDTVFYNSIRQTTYAIQNDSVKIKKYIRKFEKLYPSAEFSDIYFVVGQFYHGGTVILGTTIIEIQKNAKTPDTKSLFLFSETNISSLIEYESFLSLIIHEQVHVNQKRGLRTLFTNTLLTKTMSEGSADFIMYLITHQIPSHVRETYIYGNKHEAELWSKFQEDLEKDYDDIRKDWFYNYNQTIIPPDLGYFMGYKICEQYYNQSEDKVEAIKFILNGSNYKALMEHYSGD